MRSIIFLAIMLMAVACLAEDGELFVRNISKTPDLETDHATIQMLKQYVQAVTSDGIETTIDYVDKDGAIAESRDMAKPLVAFYHDGEVFHPEDSGAYPGHGHRDVFGAVSMDDGQTWKRENLSRSGDLSSFRLKDGTDYPGDTFRLFAGSDGNKVMVAWASRYTRGGHPNFAMEDSERDALAAYLGIDSDDLYLNDLWGVSGDQKSSDFADEGFPTVGEVPYASLWTARGTLEDLDGDGLYEIVWRQAERITSARRDVHRIEVAAVAGAGFVVTWQEDPDGLRPGHGEGPGEGWSGAVAHHETDIWYSHIPWDLFDLVDTDGAYGDPIPLAEYFETGVPAVGVPMAMPMRLTDNAMGQPINEEAEYADDPYIYHDFNGNEISDNCAESVVITDEESGLDIEVCVTEDGRLLRGIIAATRARVNLRGYDSDGDGAIDNAWVVLAYEESKGMGEEEDLDPASLIEKVDMGKNIWYHTFSMFEPELVSQGLMLNMPAVYADGYPSDAGRLVEDHQSVDGKYDYKFMLIEPDPVYEDQAGLDTVLYQTEIARRFSLISQSAADAGPSGTVAFAMWKQGIVRQGGPADVMARRFVLPDDFDPFQDNPFDYANMVGDTWIFTDGANPRYVKGLCLSPPICMSGTSIVACEDATAGCVDTFPFNEYFDDIDMSLTDALAKIHDWSQSGPDYGGAELLPDETNLDDQGWENPYDVAKGHRGFISGDFIMMLYCWSPNWLANSVGHDNYNLYVRRSFDGGVTWTTLPADFVNSFTYPPGVEISADGTTFNEWMGPVGGEYPVEFSPGEGLFEPARNVSLLLGNKLTVLDPRYAGTSGSIFMDDGTSFLYEDDQRDPSKFFITFEVGDNTTVAEGEATPMDMYYSRALNFGDDFEMVPIEGADPALDITDYFDWLENKKPYHSAEAAVMANPGGTFMYTIWNQWQEDNQDNAFDSDAILRRLMFTDEALEEPPSGGGGGGKGRK